MRNVDDNRAAKTPDGAGGVYAPGPDRRTRRRRQAAIGAVGLLAVLGTGAIVATQLRDDPDPTTIAASTGTEPTQPGAPSPSAAAASPAPGPVAPSAAAVGAARSPATPKPLTTEEQIAAVRSAAARPNNQVRPGLPPTAAAAAVDPVRRDHGHHPAGR